MSDVDTPDNAHFAAAGDVPLIKPWKYVPLDPDWAGARLGTNANFTLY